MKTSRKIASTAAVLGMAGAGLIIGAPAASAATAYNGACGSGYSVIDSMKVGDPIVLKMPYATFTYRVSRTAIVDPSDVGIVISNGTESAEHLVRNADLAMYQAKRKGKGRLEVFEGAMHDAAVHRVP